MSRSRIFLARGQESKFKNSSLMNSSTFREQLHLQPNSNYSLKYQNFSDSSSRQMSNKVFGGSLLTTKVTWQSEPIKKTAVTFSDWENVNQTFNHSFSWSMPKHQFHTSANKNDYLKNEKIKTQKEKTKTQTSSTKNIFSTLSEKIGIDSLFKGVFGTDEKITAESAYEELKKIKAKMRATQEVAPKRSQNEHVLPKEYESLYESAMDLMKKENLTEQQNQMLSAIRQNLEMHHTSLKLGYERNDLLVKILENLILLNDQTRESRIENWQQRESSKDENTQELEKLDQKMERAENIRQAQLEKLEEILKKQEEAANSRLALGVAYSSILSLIFAILVWVYQHNQDSEKEKEQKLARAEQERIKAEELAKKIEKLQLKYSGLINQKLALEDSIKTLQKNQEDLLKLKSHWWSNNTTLEIGIKQLDAKIGQEKVQLQFVLSEIKTLELYVSKRVTAEEQNDQEVADTPTGDEKPKENDREEPPVMRPFG